MYVQKHLGALLNSVLKQIYCTMGNTLFYSVLYVTNSLILMQADHTKCVSIARSVFIMQFISENEFLNAYDTYGLVRVVLIVVLGACVLHVYQMHAKTVYHRQVKTHFCV